MRVEKEIIRNEYARRINGKEAVVLVDYRGLASEGFNRLRRETERQGAGCLVVKNLIFQRVLEEKGLEGLKPYLIGQTLVFYTDSELPSLLQAIYEFQKTESYPSPRAAYWMGSFFADDDLVRLSQLPSREELLARVCSGVQAPIQGLVGTLNSLLTGLLGTINAIRDQRAGG